MKATGGACAVQHELCTVELKAVGQVDAWRRLKAFKADHLATAVAVEVRMSMTVRAYHLEAPGTITAGNAPRNTLFDQPVEGAIQRDSVVRDVDCGQRGAQLLVRQWLGAVL